MTQAKKDPKPTDTNVDQPPAPPEPGSISAQVENLAPNPAAPKPPASLPAKWPKTARVRSLFGPMRHLHTNVEITSVERKIDIDAFAQAQISAGKWEIVTD